MGVSSLESNECYQTELALEESKGLVPVVHSCFTLIRTVGYISRTTVQPSLPGDCVVDAFHTFRPKSPILFQGNLRHSQKSSRNIGSSVILRHRFQMDGPTLTEEHPPILGTVPRGVSQKQLGVRPRTGHICLQLHFNVQPAL